MLETYRYWFQSTHIAQYCPILQNLSNITLKYCPVLFNIVQGNISAHSCLSCDVVRNIHILISIDPYCLNLSNIVQYYRILWKIVQYCRQILSGIARYCSSQYFSPLLYELWCCKDIVRYIQISPDIVRHWLILSCIDQYCPLASYVDIFPLQL